MLISIVFVYMGILRNALYFASSAAVQRGLEVGRYAILALPLAGLKPCRHFFSEIGLYTLPVCGTADTMDT